MHAVSLCSAALLEAVEEESAATYMSAKDTQKSPAQKHTMVDVKEAKLQRHVLFRDRERLMHWRSGGPHAVCMHELMEEGSEVARSKQGVKERGMSGRKKPGNAILHFSKGRMIMRSPHIQMLGVRGVKCR